MSEKSITIAVYRDGSKQDVEVPLRYCAATETGYERITGKPISVFLPTYGEDGKMSEQPAATDEDYLSLVIAAILAAAQYNKQEEPVTTDDLLFNMDKANLVALVTAVIELRNEWYGIPAVVKSEPADGEARKNV